MTVQVPPGLTEGQAFMVQVPLPVQAAQPVGGRAACRHADW